MTAFERRVAGDALQLAGLVREYGPDAIGRLLDRWGPEHVRAVCVALAAAVDVERTPQELWGWLGPVDNRTTMTVRTGDLFTHADPHTLTAEEIHDMRPADSRRRIERKHLRRKRAGERGAA